MASWLRHMSVPRARHRHAGGAVGGGAQTAVGGRLASSSAMRRQPGSASQSPSSSTLRLSRPAGSVTPGVGTIISSARAQATCTAVTTSSRLAAHPAGHRARLVVEGHRLDRGGGQPPQTQQIGAHLGVGEAEQQLLGLARGHARLAGLDHQREPLGPPQPEHQLAGVGQQGGGEGELGLVRVRTSGGGRCAPKSARVRAGAASDSPGIEGACSTFWTRQLDRASTRRVSRSRRATASSRVPTRDARSLELEFTTCSRRGGQAQVLLHDPQQADRAAPRLHQGGGQLLGDGLLGGQGGQAAT